MYRTDACKYWVIGPHHRRGIGQLSGVEAGDLWRCLPKGVKHVKVLPVYDAENRILKFLILFDPSDEWPGEQLRLAAPELGTLPLIIRRDKRTCYSAIQEVKPIAQAASSAHFGTPDQNMNVLRSYFGDSSRLGSAANECFQRFDRVPTPLPVAASLAVAALSEEDLQDLSTHMNN